jgi:Endomembrane protein 70
MILLAILYKMRLRATSGQHSEVGLHAAAENAEDPSKDIFREPPKLPLLAGLVGSGIHLLAAAWMILWFLAMKRFSPLLLEPSNLEFLSALVLRLAFFFVFSGFVSSTIVLQYASASNVQGQVLKTFQQELQLVSNIDTDSTDGLEDGTNDDKIYLTTMLRRSTAWIVAMVLGFHVIVFAALSLLSMLKGTAGLLRYSKNGIFSSIGVLAVGAASCLVGMSLLDGRRTDRTDDGRTVDFWSKAVQGTLNDDHRRATDEAHSLLLIY